MLRHAVFFLLALTFAHSGFVSRVNDFTGQIGSKCEYDEDCQTRQTYCKNNRICSCKNNFEYDRHSDVCYPTKLGLKCTENYDCSALANSQCIENVCQCGQGYVAPQNGVACLPSSRLMASCNDDQQCMASDKNSRCNTNIRVCECNMNYHPSYDTQECIPSKRLQDNCQDHASCVTTPEQQDKVECRPDSGGQQRCFCKPGFGKSGNICTRAGDGGATSIAISTYSILAVIFTCFKLL